MNKITVVVPFYRNCAMLARQVQEWNKYPEGVKVICVDDGSLEPAFPIIKDWTTLKSVDRLQLYRIQIDIPWNRSGARNLGAHLAETDWIVQIDIDHILPADAAVALLDFLNPPIQNPKSKIQNGVWYRFPRWRVGKADETRRKDQIPNDCEYGQVHPHVDSYLIRRDFYLDKVGGYNEDFSGCLGGGNMFLKRASALAPCDVLPPPIRLEVYTRNAIADANDWSLSRDTTEYARRRKVVESQGNPKPINPLRFPWVREL